MVENEIFYLAIMDDDLFILGLASQLVKDYSTNPFLYFRLIDSSKFPFRKFYKVEKKFGRGRIYKAKNLISYKKFQKFHFLK